MGYWGYAPYVSVARKKAKAEKKLKQLKKKNPNIKPVIIKGKALAVTWWGKAWNTNLERYADYENRIGRGRSYVRHSAVLDLQIKPGEILALVQGSTSRPYSVNIKIKALNKKNWQEIKKVCIGKIDSLQDLLAGKFPKALSEIFTAQGKGFFPSPAEISFDCSCPDWASMCKHVAATLYGIGARLDEDPSLFFKLRKVKMDDLVLEVVKKTTDRLLEKAEKSDRRVIDDSDLGDVFGIIMEDQPDFEKKEASTSKKSKSRAKNRQKKKVLKSSGKTVIDILKNSKKGIGLPELRAKTGLDAAKIRTIIYNAYKKGALERVSRGIYKGKDKKLNPLDELETVLMMVKNSEKGIGVPAIELKTKIKTSRIRYIIARACKSGEIERVARGVYSVKKKKNSPVTAVDSVMQIIKRSRKGVGISQLREKTGLEAKQIHNILYRLAKNGKIAAIRRGVYAVAKK